MAGGVGFGALAGPLDGAGGVCGVGARLSFSADTQVVTPNGERAVGSLTVGDQVTAYDPSTGKSSTQTVQHVWLNHDHDLLDVTLHEDGSAPQADAPDKTQQVDAKAHGSQAPPSQNETIHTTANHPWLTTDRGWVTAGDLRVGEQVVALDGRTATITALTVRPGAGTYYNLTVSNLHTYAVGASRAVVHNNNCGNELIDQAERAANGEGAAVAFDVYGPDRELVGNYEFISGVADTSGPFADIISQSKLKFAGGCAETIGCTQLMMDFDGTEELEGGIINMGLWHVNGYAPCEVCRDVLQRTATRLNMYIRLSYLDRAGVVREIPEFIP